MKVLLDGLLPRLFPGLTFRCIPHEGCRDLERSIPRKLRAWNEPSAKFVVIRDNDGGDCHARKTKLLELCRQAGKEDAIVRIVCQELEAWYLGDPVALAAAFDNQDALRMGRRPKFKDPDAVSSPSDSIRRIVPEFQKVSGARRMAEKMTRRENRSKSFNCLMEGIERAIGATVT